jgi:hypothetical protein
MYEPLKAWFKSMNVHWWPVCDEVDIEPFKNNTEEWIHPILCDPLKPGEQCYKKLNYFPKDQIVDEDYYGFIHDDDMYAEGFIDKIKQQTASVIYYSMSRGQNHTHDTEAYNWPPTPLIITGLHDIRIANIDLCQYIIKGSVYKKITFGYIHDFDDGVMAEQLKEYYPDIKIFPEIGINFNYFQKGRYNEMRLFPDESI